MKLKKEELISIVGGSITTQMINSFVKLVSTLLDLGRTMGSALRYATSKEKMQLKKRNLGKSSFLST